MSRLKKLLILTAIFFLALVIFFFARAQSANISREQKQTIDLWGNPNQFILSYLPQEEAGQDNLVRYEVWYYLEQAKQVTFIAGKTVAVEEWAPEETVPSSVYLPWDFDFYTNYAELKANFGAEQLHLVDLPGFSGDGLNTYASEGLLVVLEDDYLTYLQTLAYDPTVEGDLASIDADLNPEFAELTESENDELSDLATDSQIAIKHYSSSDLGFSIDYPSDWYLNSGVLSNYDTNYLISGEALPETIAKCDFIPYELANVMLGEMNLLYEADLKIYRTRATDKVEDEDMGYGNNVVFYFEDDFHPPMILICFAYDEALDDEILSILKTFKFLD